MWSKGSIHMCIPTGHWYLRVSDGFVKIQKCVWTQAYCGHNWMIQRSIFMRLCAVQRGREEIEISKLASQTVLDQVLMEDLKRYRAVMLLQSKMMSALTIIPCPGVYSLTSTWLGSLSSKTPREATLLPQTSNHCTWKRRHMMVVHIHVHLLKTYTRQLLSNHSLGMSGGESAHFQTPDWAIN